MIITKKRVKVLIYISFFMFGLILNSNLFSQISLKTSINKSTFYIGDYIKYTVIINYNKDLSLILPPPGKELGQFDIKDYSLTDENNKSENIKIIEYTITTYFLGEYEIPSIEIQYKDKKKNKGIIKTEPLLVKVIPIKRLSTDNDDIRDIKEQIYVKTYIWLYIILIILLIGLAYSGYYLYKKRKVTLDEDVIEKKEKKLPEDIEAINQIKALQKKEYIQNKKFKIFYFELSEIIREYLNKRYEIQTLEKTSYEIMNDLKKILSDTSILKSFKSFFNDNDMVKFAKHQPGNNEIKGIIDTAITLIKMTKRKYQSDAIL